MTTAQINTKAQALKKEVEKNLAYLTKAEDATTASQQDKFETMAFEATQRAEKLLYSLPLEIAEKVYQASGVCSITTIDFEDFIDTDNF